MWIRSQNNHILANVYSLRICKCDIDGCVYYSIHGHYDRYEQELGIYSTEEKALNVLDDIQTHLKFERSFFSNAGGGDYWLDKGATVYQMPQDEEDDF